MGIYKEPLLLEILVQTITKLIMEINATQAS